LQQVVDNVDDMASSVDDAERRTSRLASSYYALIAWVAVMTAAVIAVTAATLFRRARRSVTPSLDTTSASSAASSSSPVSATIDAVERCSAPFDVTLPEVAEVMSASERCSDDSATICDDRSSS